MNEEQHQPYKDMAAAYKIHGNVDSSSSENRPVQPVVPDENGPHDTSQKHQAPIANGSDSFKPMSETKSSSYSIYVCKWANCRFIHSLKDVEMGVLIVNKPSPSTPSVQSSSKLTMLLLRITYYNHM